MGLRFTPKTHFLFQSDTAQRTAQRRVIFILPHPFTAPFCVAPCQGCVEPRAAWHCGDVGGVDLKRVSRRLHILFVASTC
jgi:hypothetical protein